MDDREFLALMRQIGLDPASHDTGALRDDYLRLTGLLSYLETEEDRTQAQPLAVFDPAAPL